MDSNNNLMMQPPPRRDEDTESLAANNSTAGDVSLTTTRSTTTTTTAPGSHYHLRPILVGYAFGPKKMSTMGIIMAEASRAQLSTTVMTAQQVPPLESIPMLEGKEAEPQSSLLTMAALQQAQSSSTPNSNSSSNKTTMPSVVLSMSRGPSGGFRNIVRYFRSSCSSVASDDTLTTATSTKTNNTTPMHCSTTTPTSTTTAVADASSSLKATSHRTSATTTTTTATTTSVATASTSKHPVRVSFVPLDLDSPLEEQHGGNFDAILHKLTEDILCLSTLPQDVTPEALDDTQLQAISRVRRLEQYHQHHPQCSVVDHPSHVQVLMSRSHISQVLSQCLVGVVSTSGLNVKTPAFVIYDACNSASSSSRPAPRIRPPLIAKPLTAAGTKKSHCMGVVLRTEGLQSIPEMPCLLQEYVNHNAILHKVYVMGDQHVSVFERPSLPNLPLSSSLEEHKAGRAFCEFDSQRPYPTLQDFGLADDGTSLCSTSSSSSTCPVAKRVKRNECIDDTSGDASSSSTGQPLPLHVPLTVDEIRPVVTVLKQAFGLELFGFDVLVTLQGELLVVDVNYFPSYKEVSNFPSLLANYLTQRAIDGRIHQSSITSCDRSNN